MMSFHFWFAFFFRHYFVFNIFFLSYIYILHVPEEKFGTKKLQKIVSINYIYSLTRFIFFNEKN